MSQGNVEIVEQAYEAFGRGDLDAISSLQDPAIEWQTSREDPDATTHRGRDAVRRYFEQYMETFPGFRAELEECLESGDGRVVATVRYTGRASASGLRMEWRQTVVYTLSRGKFMRAVEYFDHAEALEAVGLSE
jgi:uncharacterized protein